MTTEKKTKIYRICGAVITLLVLALGVAVMLSCWDIYSGGTGSYSPASIAQRFEKIAFLVYLTLAAVLGGMLLSIALPLEKQRPKAIRDDKAALNKMKTKAGILSESCAKNAQMEQKKRLWLRCGTAGIFAGMMIYPLIYFLNVKHFTVVNQNSDIIKAMTLALIPGTIGLILCYVCTLLVNRSIRRETELYKTFIAENKDRLSSAPKTAKNETKTRLQLIRWAVLAVAVLFIVVGIFNGGADDVLLKAIVICTECIGLG